MGKPSDLVQGTLDLLILKTISLEPKHGWAIAKRIQQVSGEVLQVQQGSLYPALHRLEQPGWIKTQLAERGNRRQGRIGGTNALARTAPHADRDALPSRTGRRKPGQGAALPHRAADRRKRRSRNES